MLARVFCILSVVLLGGCSTFPDSIQVADENQLIEYPQASQQPVENLDKPARWGGVIADIQNQQDATLLEIVQYPLKSYGRPLVNDDSSGRFRVYVDGFLDPMVYEKGRSITITGDFVGLEEGAVGEHMYVFPTIKAEGYHLWKNIRRVNIVHPPLWPHPAYPFYGWPYFGYPHHVFFRGGFRGIGFQRLHGRNASNSPPNMEF